MKVTVKELDEIIFHSFYETLSGNNDFGVILEKMEPTVYCMCNVS